MFQVREKRSTYFRLYNIDSVLLYVPNMKNADHKEFMDESIH